MFVKLINRILAVAKDLAGVGRMLREQREFRRYELWQSVSAFGTTLQTIYLAISGFEGGIIALLTMALASSAAQALTARWQMLFGDRHPRRSVLLLTMGAQALIAAALCGQAAISPVTLPTWALVVITVVITVVNTVYGPAESALIRDFVPEAVYQTAMIANRLIPLAATALAGGLTAVFALAPTIRPELLAANALSYLGPIIYTLRTRYGRKQPENGSTLRWWRWQGLRLLLPRSGETSVAWQSVASRFEARWALAAYAVWVIFFIRGAVMAPLTGNALFGGSQGYAFLSGATAFGVIVASLALAAQGNRPVTLRGLFIGSLWGAIWLGLYAAAFSLPLSVTFLVFGVPGSDAVLEYGPNLIVQGHVTERTDKSIHGRLESLKNLVGAGGTMLANVLAVIGVETIGIRATGIGLSALGLLVMVVLGIAVAIRERKQQVSLRVLLQELDQYTSSAEVHMLQILLLPALLAVHLSGLNEILVGYIVQQFNSRKEEIYKATRERYEQRRADGMLTFDEIIHPKTEEEREEAIAKLVDPRVTAAILLSLTHRAQVPEMTGWVLRAFYEPILALPPRLAKELLSQIDNNDTRSNILSRLDNDNTMSIHLWHMRTDEAQLRQDLPQVISNSERLLKATMATLHSRARQRETQEAWMYELAQAAQQAQERRRLYIIHHWQPLTLRAASDGLPQCYAIVATLIFIFISSSRHHVHMQIRNKREATHDGQLPSMFSSNETTCGPRRHIQRYN
ncbi:hypothetical protein [Reticulibacter mediterranei]|nr:hypothetical protein [Reticulibacter mediterranei]